jgi:hypothetical protein
MMRRMLAVGLGIAFVLSLSLSACKKKEQQPVPQAPQMPPPGMQTMPPGTQMPPGGQMPPGHGTGSGAPKAELKVVIPDAVKGQWSAVKIVVEDKGAKKVQEYKVNLNGELKIPNSDLKVVVGEFIPDFRMDAATITSASNQPNNPAVGVRVMQGDKQIFPEPGKQWGWLYSKFPAIHPFEHPKYGVTLKEGVKKG